MAERSVDEVLPLGPHISREVILRDQGAQIAILQLSGLPWELENEATLVSLHNTMNAFHRVLADPRITFGVHVVKLKHPEAPPGVGMRSWYGSKLDSDYRQMVLGAGLSRNVLYVSIACEAEHVLGARVGRRRGAGHVPRKDEISAFREIIAGVEENLANYGVLRLATREEVRNGRSIHYSEIGEAIHTILFGRWVKVPLARRMGAAIVRDRPVFHRPSRAFEVRTAGVSVSARYYGSTWALTEYPESTTSGMLDGLLSAPFAFVLNQFFSYRSKAQSLEDMGKKLRQAMSHGDEGTEEQAELPTSKSNVHRNRFVMGVHHLSLTIYAERIAELDAACKKAQNILLDAGAVAAQEDWNLDASFWAAAPGNWHKVYRKGKISSRNFAALTPLHNYPTGSAAPLWGRSVWDFKTNGDTLYCHDLHLEDVGATFVTGQTGKGKSVLLVLLMIGAVERLNARCVFFDKDRGAEPAIRAIRGSYLELRSGMASGVAPLKALSDNAADHDHLVRLIKLCIVETGEYELTADETESLSRAVSRQLRMPPVQRSWAGVRTMLGWQDRAGAGARLERWCKGGPLGWVFDNDIDQADFEQAAVGIGTTEILMHEEACGPMMAHLAYRVNRSMDGTRTVLIWDEVHKPLQVPAAAEIIADELRTIRKKEGVPILATQSPGDVRHTAIGKIVSEQTPTKIACANRAGSWEDYEWCGFTHPEFLQVSQEMTVGRRRAVISRPGASVVVNTDMGAIREHLWVLSGRTSTVNELDRIRAEVGDDCEEWFAPFVARAPSARMKQVAAEKVTGDDDEEIAA